MKAPVCALVSCLLVAVAFAEAHAGGSPAPSRWRRHSRSQRETDEADAARQLLLSLLGLPNAVNDTLLTALMPTTDNPCLPAGLSTLEAHPAGTTSPTEDSGSGSGSGGIRTASSSSGGAADGFEGTCGPQPPSATSGRTAGGGSATPAVLYGSSPVGQPAFPPSAPSLTAPISPQSPAPTCAWKWLSCSNWRIVAVNLSCSPTSLGCAGGPAGVLLSGSLPASTPELSALASLDLSGNERLVGPLSLGAWKPSWSSLRVLNLSGCGLGGPLPSDWSALPSLEVLDLSFNLLQGTLPTSLADLKHLTHLSLAGNGGLSGYLPSSWSSMERLRLLDVRGDCRLCGSTSTLPNLTTALTLGSHLDGRCRPNECEKRSSGMHNVFLGVMAAFTSILGLTALLLVLRRVHQCAANMNSGAPTRPAAGAADGRDRTGDIRRASSFPADGRGRPYRRTRTHTHRRTRHNAGPPQLVPFYTVELGPDGYVKWWVEIAGPPSRERDSVGGGGGGGGGGDRSQPLEASSPLASTTSALREGDPDIGVGDGGSSVSRRQLEMERSPTPLALALQSSPPPPPLQQQQEQQEQQQQPYGGQRVAVQEPANDEDEDGRHDGEEAGQGQAAQGEVAGRQALGSEPQEPVRQRGRGRRREQQPEREQGEGRQQQQQQEEQEEERQRGREHWSVGGFLDEVPRTAGRADAEDEAEDPAAAVVAAAPAGGPGLAAVPPAVIASEAAAAPAALPAAEDEDAVQVSNAVAEAVAGSAAPAGSLDAASAEGGRPSPHRDSGSGDAATAQPAAVAGGSPYATVVGAVPDVVRRKLAPPPDAVILMPDGEEVCLGRLMVVSYNDSDGGGNGNGDGARRRTIWTGNLEVTLEEAAAVAVAAAATSPASGPSVTLLAVGGPMGSPWGEFGGDYDDVGAGAGGGSPSAVAAAAARPPPPPGGSARGTPSITVTVSFEGSSSGASGRTGAGGGDSGDDIATGPATCPGAYDLEAVVVAAAAARAAAVSEPLGGEPSDGTASSSSSSSSSSSLSSSSSSSSRPSAAPMLSGAAPPAVASEARAASPPGLAVAKDTATTVQRVGASPGWAAPAALSVAAPAAAGERGFGGSGGGGGGGSGGAGGGGHVEAGDSRRFRLYGGGERGSRRGA